MSLDCATALQPGLQSKNLSQNKIKLKTFLKTHLLLPEDMFGIQWILNDRPRSRPEVGPHVLTHM